MLEAMRQLALSQLWLDLDGGKSADPEEWYRELRARDLGRLLPYLVEETQGKDKGNNNLRYYTLSPDPGDCAAALLEAHELKLGDNALLPFVSQPPRSPAIGPVIKRTVKDKKAKRFGPEPSTREATLKKFQQLGAENLPWSKFFREAYECWTREKVRFEGRLIEGKPSAYHKAVDLLEEKDTVLLAYQTSDKKLPGELKQYLQYLEAVLVERKYVTRETPPRTGQCALCDEHSVVVYSNGVKGAGINLANPDREGAFPGIGIGAAWKRFCVCVGCADLLYFYWNHFASQFLTSVAGEKALIIPTLNLSLKDHKEFLERVKKWASSAVVHRPGQDQVVVREKMLWDILSDDRAVNTLSILWATFGQRIEDVRGIVTDVLPSRLRQLADYNRQINETKNLLFPAIPLHDFSYDVSLSILRPLLQRPGGKKVQAINESRRLFDLRRDIANAVYHNKTLPLDRFWAEAHQTARCHWDVALASDNPVFRLLFEGWSQKRNEPFLTVSGWVRQLARFMYFLRLIGVHMPDSDAIYQPVCDALKPYFGPESAIRGHGKAFAFILGALYGKLLQVQSARQVNVGANALTWLKRLTLAGPDLPDFYNKIRNKLLEYERDQRYRRGPIVREVEAELTELQKHLGNSLQALSEVDTCYHLLLGQAVATKIMPSSKRKGASVLVQPDLENRIRRVSG